jgi:hypothetical protein
MIVVCCVPSLLSQAICASSNLVSLFFGVHIFLADWRKEAPAEAMDGNADLACESVLRVQRIPTFRGETRNDGHRGCTN